MNNQEWFDKEQAEKQKAADAKKAEQAAKDFAAMFIVFAAVSVVGGMILYWFINAVVR